MTMYQGQEPDFYSHSVRDNANIEKLYNQIVLNTAQPAPTNQHHSQSAFQYSMNSQDQQSEKMFREKTNNFVRAGQDTVEVIEQKKAHIQYLDQQQASDQQYNVAMMKLDDYYKSNPLNVIPETWEQESKLSAGMYDSQSIQKLQSKSQSQMSKRTNDQMKSPRVQVNQNDTPNQKSQMTKSVMKELNETQKSRQEERRDKIEAIKSRLKQLFLNYCDYSIDSGEIFITYTNFMKIVRDSNILDDAKGVTQNSICILISRECNTNYNMIKHISFDQYLNTILRISELKYPEVFKKYAKSALKALLKNNILPLMKRIESAVENQSDDLQYSLYTVSELTLKLIIYNEDTQVIFSDILPLIKTMYSMYFEQEINNSKGKKGDLMKLSLKSVMTFSRDFELCPYLVHQKACFLIWYSVAHSESKQELANNPEIKSIVTGAQNLGKKFTLAHFVVFIYRLGVIYFNHSQEKPQEFNLIKKLLFFMRKLENSEGFRKFMSRLSRTYNDTLTFLPSKDLLNQILKAEGVDDPALNNPEEFQFITKEAMISRIVDKHLYEGFTNLEDRPEFTDINEENDQYLLNTDDELKKLFEIYCAFGEPMNTKYLKSSKLFKMFRESGIIKGVSRLPFNCNGAKQISLPEMDLSFKMVTCKGAANTPVGDRQFSSIMSSGGDQSNQVSGFLQFQSQMLSSKMKGRVSTSQMNSNQSLMFSRTSTFDNQGYLVEKINTNKDRLDFNQFKKVLEIISQKVYPEKPLQQSYIDLLKDLLIPMLKKINDKRCVHNQMISQLLLKLDNQDMINLLTLLHKSIIDIYKVYADNKGYMNFQQYVGFCSDHDIFPDVATKASLHRIFHSLSFMNEVLGSSQKSTNGKSQMTSRMTQNSRINSPTRQQIQHEFIDEHLFVESIALIALYNEQMEAQILKGGRGFKDEINDEFANEEENLKADDDISENSPIERVLLLIEKMSNAEGVYKKIRKGDTSNAIKCNLLEKKDILELFRYKYPAYFKLRYTSANNIKKKGFDDIMEMSSIMSSVMTDQSTDGQM